MTGEPFASPTRRLLVGVAPLLLERDMHGARRLRLGEGTRFMTPRESWSKTLICPVCGLEGVARLSHVDGGPNQFETKTTVEECPPGFQARDDEDDSNILRFFCAADNVAADQ